MDLYVPAGMVEQHKQFVVLYVQSHVSLAESVLKVCVFKLIKAMEDPLQLYKWCHKPQLATVCHPGPSQYLSCKSLSVLSSAYSVALKNECAGDSQGVMV